MAKSLVVLSILWHNIECERKYVMKALDKFLKVLKTDRNTFFAYILMLCSVYVIVDRVCEFLLILITGVASEYWGPIHYTIAFAFPVFAFLFGMSSKFIKGDTDKHKMFNIYCISLYILAICMVTEWINKFIWMFIYGICTNYYFTSVWSPTFRLV